MSKTVAKAEAITNGASDPKYIFEAYRQGGPPDNSRINGIVRDGVDMSPWHCAWIRFDELDKAEKRYFQIVRHDTHNQMFNDDAFDSIHKVIGRGRGNLHASMGGIPEVYLCIRPLEAEIEEQRQMSEASANRLQDNAQLNEIKARIGSVVGESSLFGGLSMTRSGWGKD